MKWWGNTTNHDEVSREHDFLEAVIDSSTDQHLENPRRVVKHNDWSLLDLLLTDKILEPSKIEYTPPLGHW